MIRYVVRDRFGATSEAFIRVGVVQPGDPQPPIAVLDDIVAAPGRTVNADVLANDLISPDDEVTFTDLSASNEPAALEQFTKLDDNTFKVIAPEEGPAKVLAYAITDGLFDPSRATLTVRGQKGFNNPPTALDDTAVPKPGETFTTVDVLANDRDIDGDPTTLQLVEAVGEGVTVVGRQVRIQLLDHPRVVPYVIADVDGAKAMALVYVPTADNGAPYVTPGKVVQMDTNGTATVDLAEYVTDPRGRAVKITSPDTVSASPKDVLTAEPLSDTSIKLTAGRDYNGPAALMLQVTDATGPDDATRPDRIRLDPRADRAEAADPALPRLPREPRRRRSAAHRRHPAAVPRLAADRARPGDRRVHRRRGPRPCPTSISSRAAPATAR